MAHQFRQWDILIAGGGNASLCAALSAASRGASVLIVESAPRWCRGGNSRHTRNLRCISAGYPEDEFFDDLCRVTGGRTNEELARMTIRESATCVAWAQDHGVRFQKSLRGTLHLDRTNAFFLGGGKALVNSYYQAAERQNIKVLYDAEVVDLAIEDGIFRSASIAVGKDAVGKDAVGKDAVGKDAVGKERIEVRAKALVAAAGGFEANLEWLEEIWGEPARNFIIRGTPYNKGDLLKMLLAKGAEAEGDPAQFHAVAIDARAPKFDGGIVTRLDCVPLGIAVNKYGVRFYDEGEDLWPKRYAIWGRLLAQQPDQIGYSIIDSKSLGCFMPSVFPAIRAETVAELAAKLELPVDQICQTVHQFNEAVQAGNFNHTILDSCRTTGLALEKTHWARRIDQPPFFGYPLRPGITFTYLGVKTTVDAAVVMKDRTRSPNIFAAGEIMAGNILGKGYLAGFGMTIGTVFGRIAGQGAASVCK